MAVKKNEWDIKFLRDQPFMPFGSMMNAFGLLNEGKGITPEEFLKVSESIFGLCVKLTEARFSATQEPDKDSSKEELPW